MREKAIFCVSVLLAYASYAASTDTDSGLEDIPNGAARATFQPIPFDDQIKTFTTGEQLSSLRMAINDIGETFPEQYAAADYLKQLSVIEALSDPEKQQKELELLRREALLSNPAIDFDELLLVRRALRGKTARTAMGLNIGFTGNNAHSMHKAIRDMRGNEIGILRDVKKAARYDTMYVPKGNRIISDLDLHFDGNKILFSSINDDQAFRLFEIGVDGKGLKQVTPDSSGIDVDDFDACYLPDGDIIFTSTATFLGMPCIGGKPRMASLYRLSPKTGKIRQLSFDQDTAWCPTVMNDGRIVYLRWEYSDLPHSNSRILMTMNPDGTSQRSYLFSNSYFPNSFFYARPIPGDSSKVVGIATGHHGAARTGRMLLVDPLLGEHEADGVVQEIPGYGKKVEPLVRDRLVDGIWPHIVHPFPLAETGSNKGAGKYFVVSMKPEPDALWGIYLVDIFDNRVLLCETEGYGFFEPIPLKATPRPPVIPNMVDASKKTATVMIQDIYAGPGLEGVDRGEVQSLRIGSYEFSPSYSVPGGEWAGSGGLLGTIGADGPWDIKRILGTVPVYEDGSAYFTIPAATPIFIQPLDREGQALQLMRSWFIGQRGERVSCIGCHESAQEAPLPRRPLAMSAPPSDIIPWKGGMVNFDYASEIQPIVDKRCMSCHDGKSTGRRYGSPREEYQDKPIPYLGRDRIKNWRIRYGGSGGSPNFSKGYFELFCMARGPGAESDMNLLTAKEFSADTTELVQMLKKGHYGVQLTKAEWTRFYEWIDLNTPFYGNRLEIISKEKDEKAILKGIERSHEMSRAYGGTGTHFAGVEDPPDPKKIIAKSPDLRKTERMRKLGGRPFAVEIKDAKRPPEILDLGDGLQIKLVYVPAGRFIMGSSSGALDELPMHPQTIEKGFWMAETEISNAQMRRFDPSHSSRYEDRPAYQFGQTCHDVNGDELPAVRLSWKQAMAFCEWLSEKTGKHVTLPTEAQWEWACRAGTGTPFWFGESDADFGSKANLADKRIEEFAEDTSTKGTYKYFEIVKIQNPNRYEAYIPHIKAVDDGALLQQPSGGYEANPWGLYDMHGNVAEWTRSSYAPYPFKGAEHGNRRVARGGSWRDRPYRATASYRLGYPEYQKVFNVGFRIIIEDE